MKIFFENEMFEFDVYSHNFEVINYYWLDTV